MYVTRDVYFSGNTEAVDKKQQCLGGEEVLREIEILMLISL